MEYTSTHMVDTEPSNEFYRQDVPVAGKPRVGVLLPMPPTYAAGPAARLTQALTPAGP